MANGMPWVNILFVSYEKYIENYHKNMILNMCMLFDLAVLKEIIEVCRDISVGGFIATLLSIENLKNNQNVH